jgi:hypothetical protein
MLRINHHRQRIAPAGLRRLAMTGWKMTMIEPTLDDLLDDEIMTPVMRSAGVDALQLKARLAEQARRLTDRGDAMPGPAVRRACRPEALCCSA